MVGSVSVVEFWLLTLCTLPNWYRSVYHWFKIMHHEFGDITIFISENTQVKGMVVSLVFKSYCFLLLPLSSWKVATRLLHLHMWEIFKKKKSGARNLMASLYYEILDSHVLLFSLMVLLFSLYSLSRQKKKYYCHFVFWYFRLSYAKLPTYPSPKPTSILNSHLRQNVGLGEG